MLCTNTSAEKEIRMNCRDQSTTSGTEQPTTARSRLFFVRLWLEQVEGGVELRGNVRDAATGAFRAFRDLSELAAFLTDRAREHKNH
jgi:hypothetical protein